MCSLARDITRFTKKEVDTAFNQARRVLSQPGIRILHAPKQKNYGRILIITPRAIGNAVKRNKIRRQLKSIFFEEKLYTKDYDWIILTRKEILNLDFAKLKELLLSTLREKPGHPL